MPSIGFSKKQRLAQKADFDLLFKKANKMTHKCILGLFKKNQCGFGRLGVIVSKRVAKNANVRNQIKRIVRESFRTNQDRLKDFDIIVLMRQNSDSLNKVQLREVVDQLWQKMIAYQ